MSGVARYAPRHFADLLLTRGLGMVTVGFVFILPVSLGNGISSLPDEQVGRVLGEMLTTLGVFYTLIASYGLSGADLRQGFYRFLFAKPVSPVRYYAVSYALTTVVFLIGLLATVGIWSAFVRPAWPQAWLGDVIADYFLLSTLVVVFSPLTNGDWLIAPVALGLAQGLRMAYPKDETLFGRGLDLILPPTDTGRLFPMDGGVSWAPLLWQLGYAALLLGVALVVVRRMPMGSAR